MDLEHEVVRWEFPGNGTAKTQCSCGWKSMLQPTSYALAEFDRHVTGQTADWNEEEE